jgi:stearoyl-CoA desaturase (delta-9 desaturase)
LTATGIELGLHRGCAHGAFRAHRAVRFILISLGAMAAQGPPSYWVANHRRHHAYSDRDGDPHSPRDGFWHAHIMWLLDREQTLTPRFAADLLKDPDVRWIDRHYVSIVIAGLVLPGLLAGLVTGSFAGVVSGLFWGGGMRMFLVQQGTFFINSGCHRFGVRPFQTRDLATNFWPMSWPSMGQSLHNTHHAFPDSATTAVLKGDSDPAGAVLWALARLGLVSDLKTPNFDAIRAKLADPEDVNRIREPRFPR